MIIQPSEQELDYTDFYTHSDLKIWSQPAWLRVCMFLVCACVFVCTAIPLLCPIRVVQSVCLPPWLSLRSSSVSASSPTPLTPIHPSPFTPVPASAPTLPSQLDQETTLRHQEVQLIVLICPELESVPHLFLSISSAVQNSSAIDWNSDGIAFNPGCPSALWPTQLNKWPLPKHLGNLMTLIADYWTTWNITMYTYFRIRIVHWSSISSLSACIINAMSLLLYGDATQIALDCQGYWTTFT